MFDRAQLEAFSAVVQHGSFERAAKALHVTRGAISQRIKALEEALSSILVVREKPVVATPKGDKIRCMISTWRNSSGSRSPSTHAIICHHPRPCWMAFAPGWVMG
jgi:LysR family transcriptional regulator (chromosome initiation inhibitor)